MYYTSCKNNQYAVCKKQPCVSLDCHLRPQDVASVHMADTTLVWRPGYCMVPGPRLGNLLVSLPPPHYSQDMAL